MAEELTLARPYAEAVFKLAREKGNLDAWSGALDFMSAVASDPDMARLIGNPKITSAQLSDLFKSVGTGQLDADALQFVGVLVENGRVALLPHIRELFKHLKAEHEGVLDAAVSSAFPMSDEQRDSLVQDLERHFKRRVKATVSVDPELIGGVKVVLGDVVIDASVRAQLEQMAAALKR
jgi:F-type H+-transporting ATPase subunit delta